MMFRCLARFAGKHTQRDTQASKHSGDWCMVVTEDMGFAA